MSEINIECNKLPKKLFKNYFTMMVVGQNQTGKTTFVMKLYHKILKHLFDDVFVFCASDDMKEKYLEMESAAHIYDCSEIENMNGGDKITKKGIYDILKEENGGLDKRVLIIIDDLYVKDISKCENINKLFISGKHVNASVIFICQYIFKMVSELMKNNTHIFVFFKNDMKSWPIIENRIANTLSICRPELNEKEKRELAKKIFQQVYLINHHKIIITSTSFYRY